MKLETFFENFEVLAEAPNGVKKLRELILQLAVRGKLVAQNEKNEPANNLLKRIKAKKEQLIKENKIKNIDALTPINKTEVPYILPEGWDWTHIGDLILSITGGGTPSKNNPQFWNGNIPWASVKDLGKCKYLETTIDFITEKGIQNSSTNLIPKGRIIICTRMGLGKIALNKIDVAINQDLKAIELPEEFNENYFYNFYITQNIKGSGMTVSGIRQTELLNMLVPVPPLAEQHRIVAKVDQLMSLCDELEARQQKKRESRAYLNSAALDRLLAARVPGEFAEGWRRISDNFDLLYDAPENVSALRQAILQLAVMGKLMAQDEKDEPATVLMGKIKAEKERLIKEKKIKKDETLPPLTESDVPHKLPSSWQWISLGEVIDYNSAQKVSPGEIPKDAWLLDLEDIEKDTSKIIQRLTAKERESKSTKAKFRKGDVLYGKLRPYLNKVVVADSDGFCTTEIVPLRIYYGISPKYLMYALKRQDFLSYVNSKTYGVKMPRLGTNDARSAPFPLPPLAEQHRIVARVDQLMSLCDELEAGLAHSQADSEKLMEAVVGRMLAG